MLLASLLATAAAASGPGYGVSLSADATSAEATDTCAQFNVTVENTGQIPGQHEIAIDAEMEESNWTLGETPPGSVNLAPGEDETFSFTLCPPDDAEDGASTALKLTAVVESDPDANKASDSEDFTASYSATAGTQNDTFDDLNGTDDVGADPGNDTGENGDAPGPAALLVIGSLVALLAVGRRSRKA